MLLPKSMLRILFLQGLLMLMSLSAAQAAEPGGYLLVTFRGEQTALTEQVYFGLSHDGRHWTALNGGKPVLISTVGEQGARDPFVIRSADGKRFYLIATDLSGFHNRDWTRNITRGSKSIIVWKSDDLVTWSAPKLVHVAPDDAGCTWAPEAVWDEEQKNYLVFWASHSTREGATRHRIWATRTVDFETFEPPFVFIDKPRDVIDTTIVRENGRYYRFSKDEQLKNITLEWAEKLSGPWHEMPDFSLAKLHGYEGPTCFQMKSPAGKLQWCLLLDHYAKGMGYQPFVADDLASGKFEPAETFVFPYRFRHGTVLTISADEVERLEKAFGK
jgi:sucrose-6-phosphate hydrolase SacC (GH32 family)